MYQLAECRERRTNRKRRVKEERMREPHTCERGRKREEKERREVGWRIGGKYTHSFTSD